MSIFPRKLLQILTLILLLHVGQLQAGAVCNCTTMDKNTHRAMTRMDVKIDMQDKGTCCPEHYKDCLNLNCNETTDLDTDSSCYKKNVVLDINYNVQLNNMTQNLLIELDVDSLQIKFTALNLVFITKAVTTSIRSPNINNHIQSRSKIHFLTHRLRI